MRSVFGSSYPPGCSGGPYDGVTDPSALQETVLELLESAGIDTSTNDQIMTLIEAGEVRKAQHEAEGLSQDEMKAQGQRCGCRGSDDYCICQNVPDRTTLARRVAEQICADQDAQVAGEG